MGHWHLLPANLTLFDLCIRWSLIYWVLDGIGLIAWGLKASPRWLAWLGAAEICFGVTVSIAHSPALESSTATNAALFLVFVALVISQRLILQAYAERWESHWAKLRQSEIWTGKTLVGMLIGMVLAAVFLSRHRLATTVEGLAWSWMVAMFVASVIRPSGYGYHSNRTLRFFAKTSALTALATGVAFLVRRLLS